MIKHHLINLINNYTQYSQRLNHLMATLIFLFLTMAFLYFHVSEYLYSSHRGDIYTFDHKTIMISAVCFSNKGYEMISGLTEGCTLPYPADGHELASGSPDWVVGRCEASVGRPQCWQMGCMERWHRRHSLPPGKLASFPPSGQNTDCIKQHWFTNKVHTQNLQTITG